MASAPSSSSKRARFDVEKFDLGGRARYSVRSRKENVGRPCCIEICSSSVSDASQSSSSTCIIGVSFLLSTVTADYSVWVAWATPSMLTGGYEIRSRSVSMTAEANTFASARCSRRLLRTLQ